jgi:hypothetical protein
MTGLRERWPQIAAASALIAGLFVLTGVHSPARVLVVVWFITVCPGIALVRWLELEDPVAELAVAIGVSLSLVTLLAGFAILAGLWSPTTTLVVLIGITLAASVVPEVRMRWREQS